MLRANGFPSLSLVSRLLYLKSSSLLLPLRMLDECSACHVPKKSHITFGTVPFFPTERCTHDNKVQKATRASRKFPDNRAIVPIRVCQHVKRAARHAFSGPRPASEKPPRVLVMTRSLHGANALAAVWRLWVTECDYVNRRLFGVIVFMRRLKVVRSSVPNRVIYLNRAPLLSERALGKRETGRNKECVCVL